jgi:hypothetical protein
MPAHIPALGYTSYSLGEFLPAREHPEVAISIYDLERHRPFVFYYGGTDTGVDCLSCAATTLGQLGFRTRLSKEGNEAPSDPFSLAFAGRVVGILRQYSSGRPRSSRLRKVN